MTSSHVALLGAGFDGALLAFLRARQFHCGAPLELGFGKDR